jgi:hypothetical protein
MRDFLTVVGLACLSMACASTGTDGASQLTALSETGRSAQESPLAESAPSIEAAADESGKSKVVCRKVGSTGSRLSGQRICRTRAQWDEEARRTQKDLGKLQHGNGGATVAN